MVDEAKFDLFQSILEQADSMGLHSDKFEVPEAPAELEHGWYRDGRLDGERFSHAASGLKTEEVFDFGVWELGKFRLEVELLRDDIDGGGMLRVRWDAERMNPDGWWLAFITGEDESDITCEIHLGESKEGSLLLDNRQLQFDPMLTPFRYLIFSKNQ